MKYGGLLGNMTSTEEGKGEQNTISCKEREGERERGGQEQRGEAETGGWGRRRSGEVRGGNEIGSRFGLEKKSIPLGLLKVHSYANESPEY